MSADDSEHDNQLFWEWVSGGSFEGMRRVNRILNELGRGVRGGWMKELMKTLEGLGIMKRGSVWEVHQPRKRRMVHGRDDQRGFVREMPQLYEVLMG